MTLISDSRGQSVLVLWPSGEHPGARRDDRVTPAGDRSAAPDGQTSNAEAWGLPGASSKVIAALSEREGQQVLVVAGPVDQSTAPTLATLLVALDSGEAQVVVDLRLVTSMDPAGVTMFLQEHGRLAGGRRTLVLDSPTGPVRRTLDQMGMNDIVVIRPALPTAPGGRRGCPDISPATDL